MRKVMFGIVGAWFLGGGVLWAQGEAKSTPPKPQEKPKLKELLPKPEQLSGDEEEVEETTVNKKPKKKWLEPSDYTPPEDPENPDVKAKRMGVYSYCRSKTGEEIRSDEPGYPRCIEEMRIVDTRQKDSTAPAGAVGATVEFGTDEKKKTGK